MLQRIKSAPLSLLALALIFSITLSSCEGSESAPTILQFDNGGTVDLDGDGVADGQLVDTDGDGNYDGLDTDGDGIVDISFNEIPDTATVDIDGDGTSDGQLVDSDGDGAVDGLDTDGDGSSDIDIEDVDEAVAQAESGSELSDVIAVNSDKSDLAITYTSGDSSGSVTGDLTLPTSGDNGSTISWSSSDTSVIAADGTVTRPASTDASVMLTATISLNGVSVTKTFTVTVAGISATAGTSSSSALSALTVSGRSLDCDFSSTDLDYFVAVPFSSQSSPAYDDTQSVTITPTALNAGASITINGTAVTSGNACTISDLAVGPNSVTVVVTAEDDTTTTYTLDVYRALPIFKTGQTTSYADYDDGYYQSGVSWPSTRFTAVGTDAIKDEMTGLVWLKSVSTDTYTWTESLTYCEALATGGYEWRMPNVRELRSLVNFSHSSPYTWLNGQGFANVQGDYYLSGTTSALSTDNTWGIDMYYGKVMGVGLDKTVSRYSLPVKKSNSSILAKSGQETTYASGDDGIYQAGVDAPSTRFVANGDGTITDNLTGLMWLQNLSTTTCTWTDAISYCEGLTTGSYTDWRLPTVNELETLINYGQDELYTWLNEQGFVNAQSSSYYWSATTHAPVTDRVWILVMNNGNVIGNIKTQDNAISAWPVRGPVE